MQDTRETSDNQKPTPYEKGQMFYQQSMLHNPYQPDTDAFTEFYRGLMDADEDAKLSAKIDSWD